MALGTSAIDKLGERLRQADPILEADLELLQELRLEFDDSMAETQRILSELVPASRPTTRLKTVQTLVGKLRRERTMNLSQVQDVAGVRIVREMGLADQDAMVERIAEAFGGAKVIDRRAKPTHGYRAVHIVPKVDGRLVEIQVRTQLQDRWAQIVERLADQWGRRIRYGDAADEPQTRVGPLSRTEVVDMARRMSPLIATCEQSEAQTGGRLYVPSENFRRAVTKSLSALAKLNIESEANL